MLFLFGEAVYAQHVELGSQPCPICSAAKPFHSVVETCYFTIFSLRILPIEKLASYWQCSGCENSFPENNLQEPSCLPVLKRVVVYLMLGYGRSQHRDKARAIVEKVSATAFDDQAIQQEVRDLESGNFAVQGDNMQDYLKDKGQEINLKGKLQIIEGAFLMTYVCCEMEFEDRLRINLMANALGLGLENVEAVIDSIRQKQYLGITRLI